MPTSAPELALLNPSRTTKLSADASKDGIGVRLSQRYDASLCPAAYASRPLADSESRYSLKKRRLGLYLDVRGFIP